MLVLHFLICLLIMSFSQPQVLILLLAPISGFHPLLKFLLVPHTALPQVTLGKVPFPSPPGSQSPVLAQALVVSIIMSLALSTAQELDSSPHHRDAPVMCACLLFFKNPICSIEFLSITSTQVSSLFWMLSRVVMNHPILLIFIAIISDTSRNKDQIKWLFIYSLS